MIANIDENSATSRRALAERGIEDNTIVIFMTETEPPVACDATATVFSPGIQRRDARQKAWYYTAVTECLFSSLADGGNRTKTAIDELSLGIDIFPTLVDLCALSKHKAWTRWRSLAPLLRAKSLGFPMTACIFEQFHRVRAPDKWETCHDTAVASDPRPRTLRYPGRSGQRHDVATQHPDIVERLRGEHEHWWAQIEPGLREYCPITIGSDAEIQNAADAMT